MALLPLITIIPVSETLSVVYTGQGTSRLTKGRRFFKMAPIHLHFELLGWSETQIVQRFWLMSLMGAMVGIAVLVKDDNDKLARGESSHTWCSPAGAGPLRYFREKMGLSLTVNDIQPAEQFNDQDEKFSQNIHWVFGSIHYPTSMILTSFVSGGIPLTLPIFKEAVTGHSTNQ